MVKRWNTVQSPLAALTALFVLLALGGCSNLASAACEKEMECCATFKNCDTYQKTGAVDRCVLFINAQLEFLSTYSSNACKIVLERYKDLLDCWASASCASLGAKGCKAAEDALDAAQHVAGSDC